LGFSFTSLANSPGGIVRGRSVRACLSAAVAAVAGAAGLPTHVPCCCLLWPLALRGCAARATRIPVRQGRAHTGTLGCVACAACLAGVAASDQVPTALKRLWGTRSSQLTQPSSSCGRLGRSGARLCLKGGTDGRADVRGC
jgi:hypothetical protein